VKPTYTTLDTPDLEASATPADLCAPAYGSCLVFNFPAPPVTDADLDAYMADLNAHYDAIYAADVCETFAAKGCRGCRSAAGTACVAIAGPATPLRLQIEEWITNRLGPDLLTPKPGAPECPGRVPR